MIHDARAGQQFRQLPMFMTAREIRNQYQPLDGDRDDVYRHGEYTGRRENEEELFDRKYDEAENSTYDDEGQTLKESILTHGVKNPVSLQADMEFTGSDSKPEILGGHHRVAVMHEHRRDDLMPVEHFDNIYLAQRSLGERY
jgi:hypothetical protein